ncbi:MAG TPA: helix-turn-helix domain-containing protein [Marmoricola sp.]|nr:helix-turn-helix domain-containing protein [Marmoricola sp.]
MSSRQGFEHKTVDAASIERQVAECIVHVARSLGERLTEMASALHLELAGAIPELQGDPVILELLRASVEGNIETFVHLAQHAIPIEDVAPPSAAIAYAHRLAQRGTSSNALLRAYRLGQRRMTTVFFADIARHETDPDVAYATAEKMQDMLFAYIDNISEQVAAAYESERERWLANRNTVRATTLTAILEGAEVDVAAGESALSYRLRQHHLGVVVWDPAGTNSTTTLQRLEAVVRLLAESVGATGQPMFMPQDGAVGWAWIPLGREAATFDIAHLQRTIAATAGSVRVSLGTVGAALPGFRTTHLEALRASRVASLAAEDARLITTYEEPGVRASALLAGDIASARDLVAGVLGPLGVNDEATERLRETLLVFLSEGGSFRSAGERLHVHRNTVKYRVDRAIEIRGRALDDDRFNLELALLACQWLGPAVLA